jgi:hypothetical protein
MATIPFSTDADRGEARFFFTMACLMAATVFTGFGFNIVTGRSSFGLPLVYHAHAFIFSGWVLLYVLQSGLIFGGNVALHRRLGWLSLFFIPAVVVMGIFMIVRSVRLTGGPPFFDVNGFLISGPPLLIAFGVLATWAVAVRKDTGWHRRLMFSAVAIMTGPAISRILPMPLFIPWGLWVSVFVPLVFPLIGAAADWRRYGRVHPAWYWGIGVVVVFHVVSDLVAYSPLGYALTEWALAGTPGAERQMEAFFPPM